MDLRGKKVTVVGLGRSGLAACNLLIEKGAKVSITDCLDNQKIRENLRSLHHQNIIQIEIGGHSEGLIANQDLVVTSPGVPTQSLPIMRAREKGIAVIGEIELAFRFCPAPIVAITGTNGKTTVATLVGEILKAAGRKCVVCGNIGKPFCGEVSRLSPAYIVVLEISSFQLETIDKFRPKVAVVLNLTTDHLDRYTNLDEYIAAKSRIFSNQTDEDWAVLNKEDPYTFSLAAKTKARCVFFSQKKDINASFKHFNSNHSAAAVISSLFNISEDVAIETCRRFKGVEHRIEEVAQVRGVKFINDSKATNVDSTLWALDSINEPIILIAGGRDKGCDFLTAREKVKEKVKAMVLIGEAKDKIEKTFSDLVLTKKSEDLFQAVGEAFSLSSPGDCVLLSPMCASFDMFSDYVERGRVFKQAVLNLVKSSKLKV